MKTIIMALLLLSLLGCITEPYQVRYPGEVVIIENHRGLHEREYHEHQRHERHR
jgi:hypothetical protein